MEEIVKKAIENDDGSYSRITGLDYSQIMNNDDENELANQTVDNRDCISICSPSWNEHTTNNDDEDCFSASSVG